MQHYECTIFLNLEEGLKHVLDHCSQKDVIQIVLHTPLILILSTAVPFTTILPKDTQINWISSFKLVQNFADLKGRPILGKTLMVFLCADRAALGLWHGDVLRQHKIFTGYTVRKSKGGGQAKYLRS